MILELESALRLSEAILSQASKDYIHDYKIYREFPIEIENYIRSHPIVGPNADYIIANLRKLAVEKTKVKRKTHRVRVTGKEI